MKKPIRKEFMEEMKYDGILYKSVHEEAYRIAMRKYNVYKREQTRHVNEVE